MTRKIFTLTPLVAALAISLAACGGGDGSSTPAPTPAPTPSTPPASGDGLVHQVPPATYTHGSEEQAAFNLLNQARSSCGWGLLAQNILLDNTARGHADWIVFHNIPGHFQTIGSHRFTGVTMEDRAIAAGYNPPGGFIMQDSASFHSGTFGNDKSGFGAYGVRGLLNAPYHAVGLLDGFRDVGISVRNAEDAGAPDATVPNLGRKVIVINPAHSNRSGSQLMALAPTDVLTYPCNGSTDIEPGLYGERPNPVPGRDLLANPLGSSVQIAIKEGHTLTISSASMRVASTGVAVVLRVPITSANDPHIYGFASNRGYIVADSPLAENTTYHVEINGTNNGVQFTRAFDFTTGVQTPVRIR